MKNIKKLVSLGISLVIATSIFTGCSKDEVSFFDAYSKTQKAASMEMKTDMGLRVSATGLSERDQKEADQVFSIINDSKMTMNAKINQNQDNTAVKMEAKMDVSIPKMSMLLDMGFWVDSNITDGKANFKEIIKMPGILTTTMGGKEYMVMDSSKMLGAQGMDYNKLTKVSQDMQKRLHELILKNMTSFDPGMKVIADNGSIYMTLPEGEKIVHMYQLRLDDATFKDLVKYTANNLVNNKEAVDFVKDYILAMTEISALKPEKAEIAKAEVNKAFNDFQNGLPQFVEEMNKSIDSFSGVKIIGEKGIVINYAVDDKGYVVNESGNMDFTIDIAKVAAATGQATSNKGKVAGVFNLGIDFNTNYFNINKDVEIKFPELNKENSMNYEELFNRRTVKK